MQDTRALLRHYYGEQSSQREIARLLQLSPGTVRNYLRRAAAAGLSWPLPERLTDEALEALLFLHSGSISSRPQPDWNQVHQQLSRKGMTLERIWFDWIQAYPEGYSYGYFCACYKKLCRSRRYLSRCLIKFEPRVSLKASTATGTHHKLTSPDGETWISVNDGLQQRAWIMNTGL